MTTLLQIPYFVATPINEPVYRGDEIIAQLGKIRF
jgi:hypothetical protein